MELTKISEKIIAVTSDLETNILRNSEHYKKQNILSNGIID